MSKIDSNGPYNEFIDNPVQYGNQGYENAACLACLALEQTY